MTDGPARFQALLESALRACEKGAPGVTLADLEDPLAARLQTCHSIDDITLLLQGQVRPFNDFRQRDRIFKAIKTTVSMLTPISSVTSGVGVVRRKATMDCFTSLTAFIDITPASKGDTRYCRNPTGCTCCPRVHM